MSKVTSNNHERAHAAFRDAIQRKGRGPAGSQLLASDVEYAIEICKEANATDPPAAPADVVAEDAEEIRVEDLLNEATADMGLDDTTRIPPPRSPTFSADDEVVKQKLRPKSTHAVISGGGWCYDDEVERLEELKLIQEAKAAELAHFQQKRRLRELARQHGKSKGDAITLRSHEDGG